MKVLSIIIPSYNMEKYLYNCLTSLEIPSIDLLDIIVVNDGSKDKTLEIANKFHEKYPNSIKVINKKNGNYGSCINVGLKEATGKYVKILDADDTFDKSNFEIFINKIKDIDYDLIISDYCMVDEDGNDFFNWKLTNTPIRNFPSFDSLLKYTFDVHFQMHAITYRLSNLKKINYKQLEGIPYTDQQWMFYPMTAINNAYYFDKVLYKYLVGRSGQTVSSDMYVKNSDAIMTITYNLFNDYLKVQKSHKYFEYRLLYQVKVLYYIFLIRKNDITAASEIRNFDYHLKRQFPIIYEKTNHFNLMGYPIKYIKFWRKNNYDYYSPFLKLLRWGYNLRKNFLKEKK